MDKSTLAVHLTFMFIITYCLEVIFVCLRIWRKFLFYLISYLIKAMLLSMWMKKTSPSSQG